MKLKRFVPLAACLATLLLGACSPSKPPPEPEFTGLGVIPDSILNRTAKDVDNAPEINRQRAAEAAERNRNRAAETAALQERKMAETNEPEPPWGSQQLPSFMKPYYAAMLNHDNQPYKYLDRGERLPEGHSFYVYFNTPTNTGVAIWRRVCAPRDCDPMARRIAQNMGMGNGANVTDVRPVAPGEYQTTRFTGGRTYTIRIFVLPDAVSAWGFITRSPRKPPQDWFDKLTPLIERERIEDAARLERQAKS